MTRWGRLDPQKSTSSGRPTNLAREDTDEIAVGAGWTPEIDEFRSAMYANPTKPYKLIGFGAIDVTNPYNFIGFGNIDIV